MTPEEQIDLWVAGQSIHNNTRTYNVLDKDGNVIKTLPMQGGECCPDFSCCKPELLWSLELRQKFKNADQDIRHQMLMLSLGALLTTQLPDKKVHIAGMLTPAEVENPN